MQIKIQQQLQKNLGTHAAGWATDQEKERRLPRLTGIDGGWSARRWKSYRRHWDRDGKVTIERLSWREKGRRWGCRGTRRSVQSIIWGQLGRSEEGIFEIFIPRRPDTRYVKDFTSKRTDFRLGLFARKIRKIYNNKKLLNIFKENFQIFWCSIYILKMSWRNCWCSILFCNVWFRVWFFFSFNDVNKIA